MFPCIGPLVQGKTLLDPQCGRAFVDSGLRLDPRRPDLHFLTTDLCATHFLLARAAAHLYTALSMALSLYCLARPHVIDLWSPRIAFLYGLFVGIGQTDIDLT